eukprot:TRINITY_DN39859_c0_g1_i1.p1 TRINITY_DN39859_c0_g1~~TRINITY_DN39859_c0_g1_i1.p1  ORF type:complete len:573 (+),score=107.07 TRINITY_DN39859_c0_g1_i1:58-1719(+)
MSKKVVVASGYFNPLHYGHVSYLEKAREAGTSLIVIVNNDYQAMQRSRGSNVVSLPARERVKLVRSLACVDAAMESVDMDDSIAETLRLIHPDIFANGGGHKPTDKEREVCNSLGIRMIDGLGIEIMPLKGYTQHYDWGKPRKESVVAQLAGEQSPKCNNPQEAHKPFAELWMGDHPSGPSSVVLSPVGEFALPRNCSLNEVLERTPSVLGPKLADNKQLPFLLKVLSIHKALSIQAHPDKVLAARLHQEKPHLYKDANHKPEIAIALSDDFEALCGFRPHSEIIEMLERVPELRDLIGAEGAEGLKTAEGASAETHALRFAYGTMMRRSQEEISTQSQRLHSRLKQVLDGVGAGDSHDVSAEERRVLQLVRKLYDQYGDDVGVFSPFLMNYVTLGIGSCLYMAQNVPHAYLSGDIVECMACSDNVVRGGLTPKFKDVDVLCEMLDYRGRPPATVKPVKLEDGVLLYSDPDIEEFQVTHVSFAAGTAKRMCFSSLGPSMLFAQKGNGTIVISSEPKELEPGKAFMLSAGVEPDIRATTQLDLFVACCPPTYFH